MQTISPQTLVTGQSIDHNKHCKYEFRQYVQVHDQHDNSLNPRTTRAIALCPAGNAQGNFYFLSLTTGQWLNQVHATPLPMPDDVIKRIEHMARQQEANPGLMFLDWDQQPLEDMSNYYYDEDQDDNYEPDNDNLEESDYKDDYKPDKDNSKELDYEDESHLDMEDDGIGNDDDEVHDSSSDSEYEPSNDESGEIDKDLDAEVDDEGVEAVRTTEVENPGVEPGVDEMDQVEENTGVNVTTEIGQGF